MVGKELQHLASSGSCALAMCLPCDIPSCNEVPAYHRAFLLPDCSFSSCPYFRTRSFHFFPILAPNLGRAQNSNTPKRKERVICWDTKAAAKPCPRHRHLPRMLTRAQPTNNSCHKLGTALHKPLLTWPGIFVSFFCSLVLFSLALFLLPTGWASIIGFQLPPSYHT